MNASLGDLRAALAAGLRAARRITPGPLLVRGMILVSGALALGMALPAELFVPAGMLGAVLAALIPALAPGSWAVTGFELVAVGMWIARTGYAGSAVGWLPVVGFAATLYVHHAAAALAAAVPLDAVVLPAVLVRWSARTGVVLAATALLGAALLAVAGRLPTDGSLVAPLVGLVCAVTIGGLLAFLMHGRRPGGS